MFYYSKINCREVYDAQLKYDNDEFFILICGCLVELWFKFSNLINSILKTLIEISCYKPHVLIINLLNSYYILNSTYCVNIPKEEFEVVNCF